MMDDPEVSEPALRFRVLDLMAFVTAIACFYAAARVLGWVSIALLPVFVIAPSVLAHPENTRAVKVSFVAAMLLTTVVLFWRGA